MPYPTKTLSQLRTQVAQDIQAQLPGTDPLLRFNNLGILGAVLAGLVRELYGYIAYTALQSVPYTAQDEWLEAWAAVKSVFRIPAAPASGVVSFAGAPDGTPVPAGSKMTRGDGVSFTSTATVAVSGGIVLVPATADADPTGLEGAFGNTDAGALMTLSIAIVGISSTGTVTTAFTGGADLESDGALRTRMLLAFQSEDHGGNLTDYIRWTLTVPGVTRVWIVPHEKGPGTVSVFPMFDVSESAHNGFPQGTDGVATSEPRDTAATGDQLAVANVLFPLQPVTALVYARAPTPYPVPFTLTGTAAWSPSTKTAVEASLAALFVANGEILSVPGPSTILLSDINASIGAVPGTGGYSLTSPSANVSVPFADLPTVGAMTYLP